MAALDTADGIRVEVLGPVEAWVDGRSVALGGPRPRTLLAALVLARGQVVAAGQLIDELWGEDPPARARASLQMHVSRVRKAVTEAGGDAGRLVSRAGGYVLELRPGACDVDRWEAALGRARQARAADDLEAARTAIDEALGIWRGAPLGGVQGNGRLEGERARLEEERLAATLEGLEIDLELGRHGDLLARLEPLVVAHPFKERLVALQMTALHLCGRQADALAAYRSARTRFVEELGIEPGPGLRRLHEDILRDADTPAAGAVPAPRAARVPRAPPAPPNRTIGRERDLDAIGERFRAGARLLTLAGPGGVGKTRLAQEAARGVEHEFADGACWVPLAALQRADDVPAAIVQALGVVVLSGESAADAVRRSLATKHLLLVVDNFEQVMDAARFLGELLEACPALTVLATSREPLALRAEQRYPVSPLALPEPEMYANSQELAGVDAVALFCERAVAQDPGFEPAGGNSVVVAELCRRLDGLPLAIELTAARCGLLSVAEIAERLTTALGAQGSGLRDAPARQQTLRATVDWSHELLGEDERRCFARFSVFAGGATLEAAEAVTRYELDTLDRLVAKSLLVRHPDASGRTRLGMLATIRAYAAERLASGGEERAVREAHYTHYLGFAEHHGNERMLWGPDSPQHVSQLDAEVNNLQAALGWATGQGDAAPALALVAAIGCYWVVRDRFADAVKWVDRALGLPAADAHPDLCAQALRTKAICLGTAGCGPERDAALAVVETIARRLGDARLCTQVLQLRVDHEIFAERLAVADTLADDALRWARAAGDPWEIAMASRGKAVAASSITELRERVETAAALLADVGNMHHLGRLLNDAAYAALCLGSERDAKQLAARAAPIVSAMDSRYARMINSGNRGLAELLTGEADAASRAFRDELDLCREMTLRHVAFEGFRGLAAVAVVNGDDERAATLVGAADAQRGDKTEDPVEARLDETYFHPARSRYGQRAWDAAVRDARASSFEEAIAYALEETPAPTPGRR